MIEDNFFGESKRKFFHLTALIFPIAYIFMPKSWMILSSVVAVIIPIYIDIFRHYNPKVQVLVEIFFIHFMRDNEATGNFKPSGVTYMMLGILVTVILFSKPVAITSLVVLILADSAAALVGRKIGVELPNGKSLEGAAAFVISAIMISLMCREYIELTSSFAAILFASIAAAMVEFFSKEIRIDDNLSIPLTFGAILTIAGII